MSTIQIATTTRRIIRQLAHALPLFTILAFTFFGTHEARGAGDISDFDVITTGGSPNVDIKDGSVVQSGSTLTFTNCGVLQSMDPFIPTVADPVEISFELTLGSGDLFKVATRTEGSRDGQNCVPVDGVLVVIQG